MKKYFVITVVLVMSVLTLNAQNKKGEKTAKQPSKSEVIYHIANMHGEHCKNIITENIAFEKGVNDLVFDLDGQNLTIVFNSQRTQPENLKAALEKLGYEVTPFDSTAKICPVTQKPCTGNHEKGHNHNHQHQH